MVRGIMTFCGLLTCAVLVSAQELKPQAKPEPEKNRSEFEGIKLILEAEQQRTTSLQKVIDSQRTVNLEMQKQIEELRKTLESTVRERDSRTAQMQAEIEQLKSIVKQKDSEQQDVTQQRDRLAKERDELKKLMIAEEVKNRDLVQRSERAEMVLRHLEESHKQTQARITGKPVALEKNRGVPNVRGKVTELDASKQLLVINLGAEAGLKMGDSLELFRVATDPKASLYLGKVTIVRINETSAVCRYSAVTDKQPQLDDLVGTDLSK